MIYELLPIMISRYVVVIYCDKWYTLFIVLSLKISHAIIYPIRLLLNQHSYPSFPSHFQRLSSLQISPSKEEVISYSPSSTELNHRKYCELHYTSLSVNSNFSLNTQSSPYKHASSTIFRQPTNSQKHFSSFKPHLWILNNNFNYFHEYSTASK